jgi:hypothetical protein
MRPAECASFAPSAPAIQDALWELGFCALPQSLNGFVATRSDEATATMPSEQLW